VVESYMTWARRMTLMRKKTRYRENDIIYLGKAINSAHQLSIGSKSSPRRVTLSFMPKF
jgi:hypothetical protein